MATSAPVEHAPLVTDNDVSVERAVAATLEQDAAVVAVAVASAEAAPAPSKRAAKKAKKPKQSEQDAAAAAAAAEVARREAIAASVDHPYLSFLHKRIRLYKKKLEKIRALEAALANEGKVLNDQQQEVVVNKPLVEKMISEFESLREQFIDVYVAEEDEKKKQQEEEEGKEKESGQPTDLPPVEATTPVADAHEAKAMAPAAVELVPRDVFAYVEDLLRTLHAVTLHQALGKDVPPVLDYFSKVLLGTTRPPAEVAFEDNLVESLEEATRYLTRSDKIVALEYTYQDLRAMVEALGGGGARRPPPATSVTVEDVTEESVDAGGVGGSGGFDVTDTVVVAQATTVTVVEAPAAEKLPHINFFTDSHIDAEGKVAGVADVEDVVTEDKDNQHEKLPEANEPTASEEATEDSPVEEEAEAGPVEVAPPKSFAAATAAAGAHAGKSVWNRKPKSVTAAPHGLSDERPHQHRRPQGRSKSPRTNNGEDSGGKTTDDANGAVNNQSNNYKPRRPRPQRANDENGGPHNANRSHSAGGKGDDRRPRSERPFRKQHQPPHQQQQQQYREAAQV